MNIALVAQGRMPIPREHLGSIENIIWNNKLHLEALGHKVKIYNTIWIHEAIYELNKSDYDFIHLHSDLYALMFSKHLKKPFCLTSHCGGFSRFVPGSDEYYPAFNYLFNDSLLAPGNFVLSPQIADLYKQADYKGFLRSLPNPIEEEKFVQHDEGNGRAIYVGKIQPRKRQSEVAQILDQDFPLDFVGPFFAEEEPSFIPYVEKMYKGSWSRKEIYERLGTYSCLVLLSKSEVAAALVVHEALAAGLSVVVNESCSGNLTSQPFITVIPDEEIRSDVIRAAIQDAITENKLYRKDAREYAHAHFSHHAILPKYLRFIEEFRSEFK